MCWFKTWLLNLTRWRIQDQIRKRARIGRVASGTPTTAGETLALRSDDTTSTTSIERVPDPNVPEFGAEWDAAWERNLLTQALERVRDKIDERQFQVFDLYAVKGWSPADVAQTLGISVARVYLTRHRVSALLKQEVKRLEKIAGQALRRQPSR